jgi:hypothetical protein
VLALLEGYAESLRPNDIGREPYPMSIADLKIVKTAIGVLLNTSFGYGKLQQLILSYDPCNCLVQNPSKLD